MGRSTTPMYSVEIDGMGRSGWHVRHGRKAGDGPPTAKNLARYMGLLLKSMEPGGVNAHLASYRKPAWARIRENCCGGAVLAEWHA